MPVKAYLIVLFAAPEIASTFANLDLFDEYRLMVHPIVLGQGIPLFKGVTPRKPRVPRADVIAVRVRDQNEKAALLGGDGEE